MLKQGGASCLVFFAVVDNNECLFQSIILNSLQQRF